MDAISVTILEDGTIKIETDPISPANHVSAEQLLDAISRLSGGEVTRTKKHSHAHTHVHRAHEQESGH